MSYTNDLLIPTSGLTHYWTFNEGCGDTVHDEVGLLTGTLLNSPSFVTGVSGYGLDFDGTDMSVKIDDDTSIQNIFDGGGSVSVWVNVESDGGADAGRILDKDKADNDGWLLWVNSESGGTVRLSFLQRFTTTPAQYNTSTNVLTIGKTHHIVVTYDNSSTSNNAIIYVDGEVVATNDPTPVGTRKSDVGNDLYVGNVSTEVNGFDGMIDKPRFYNKIITASDAEKLYKNTRRFYTNDSK